MAFCRKSFRRETAYIWFYEREIMSYVKMKCFLVFWKSNNVNFSQMKNMTSFLSLPLFLHKIWNVVVFLKVWFYKVSLESPKIVISKQVHPNLKVIYFIHFEYSKQVNVCSIMPIYFYVNFYSAKCSRATFLPIFVSKFVWNLPQKVKNGSFLM